MVRPRTQTPYDSSGPAKIDEDWVEAILSGWAQEEEFRVEFSSSLRPTEGGLECPGGVNPAGSSGPGLFSAGSELLEWQHETGSWGPKEVVEKGKPGKGIQGIHAVTFAPLRKQDQAPEFDRTHQEGCGGRFQLLSRAGVGKRLTFLGGSVLLAVLGLWTGGLLRMTRETQSRSGAEERRETPRTAGNPGPAVAMIPEMKMLLRSFFAASNPDEKSAFVRGGKALLPVMRDYYSKHSREPAEIKVDASAGFVNEGDLEFVRFTGSSGMGEPFEALVQKTPSGPRLDWRHLTGSTEVEWNDWVRARPSKPVSLCVLAALDDYYGGLFTDPKKWVCLKMTDIRRSSTVWAYASRTNSIGTLLMQEFRDRKRVLKFKGSFEFPSQTGAATSLHFLTPQAAIRSVQSLDWIDRSAEVALPGGLFLSLSP